MQIVMCNVVYRFYNSITRFFEDKIFIGKKNNSKFHKISTL